MVYMQSTESPYGDRIERWNYQAATILKEHVDSQFFIKLISSIRPQSGDPWQRFSLC
jgi:hypothetical protein